MDVLALPNHTSGVGLFEYSVACHDGELTRNPNLRSTLPFRTRKHVLPKRLSLASWGSPSSCRSLKSCLYTSSTPTQANDGEHPRILPEANLRFCRYF
jgi:hypothetical protein